MEGLISSVSPQCHFSMMESNNVKKIYFSKKNFIAASVVAGFSALFLLAIFIIDRSNPNIHLLLMVLAVSVVLIGYFGRETVLSDSGLNYNGNKIKWDGILSIEEGDDLILNTSEHGRITIPKRHGSFYDLVNHIKKHKKGLFHHKKTTHFNDRPFLQFVWFSLTILTMGFVLAIKFFIQIDWFYTAGAFLLLSAWMFVLDYSFEFIRYPVILEADSLIIKRPFLKNLHISYSDTQNITLEGKRADDIFIELRDGKDVSVFNHSKNCQFLYDNLVSAANSKSA